MSATLSRRKIQYIEKAKTHELKRYRFLSYIVNKLTNTESLGSFEKLLFWNADKEKINRVWRKKVDGF